MRNKIKSNSNKNRKIINNFTSGRIKYLLMEYEKHERKAIRKNPELQKEYDEFYENLPLCVMDE